MIKDEKIIDKDRLYQLCLVAFKTFVVQVPVVVVGVAPEIVAPSVRRVGLGWRDPAR